MKKKHLNILLLILVLIIYGGVFLKLFGKKEVQLDDSPYNTSFSKQATNFDIKRNDFDISTIKSDPFGIDKKRTNKQTVTNRISKTNQSSVSKVPQKKHWPFITYFGFVKNNVNTTRLALIKIDNKLYRKREKESIEDISIVQVYNDSIVLKMNNETKTITRINEKFKDFTTN